MENLKRRLETLDQYYDLLNKKKRIEKEIENVTAYLVNKKKKIEKEIESFPLDDLPNDDYLKQVKDDLARANMNDMLHRFLKFSGRLTVHFKSNDLLSFEEYTQRFYLNEICQKMLDDKIIQFDFEEEHVIVSTANFYLKHLLSMYLIDDLALLVLSFDTFFKV